MERKRLIYLAIAVVFSVLGVMILCGAFPLPPAPWNLLILFASGVGIFVFLRAYDRARGPGDPDQ
jgi:hypothetical protein